MKFLKLSLTLCVLICSPLFSATQQKEKPAAPSAMAQKLKKLKPYAYDIAKCAAYATGTGAGCVLTVFGFAFTRDCIRLPEDVRKEGSNFYVVAGTCFSVATYGAAHVAWYCFKNGYDIASKRVKECMPQKKEEAKKS